ncbi:hypothetical protein JYU34_002562 [Plutella xylostella]|uniref:Integrase catalytic domain-containing protein n=1 Tax=Plutella xylostella TaxID=51655 RepID=A0ABQ7R2I5_PLUXY|nr:hypothetical protein JYU34_002562 [Plutella xylostella]
MYRQDANELKRVIMQAVSLFGVPKLMVTDKGRMFESSEFVTWVSSLGCELHFITPEMHHANGQVERYVRTVLNMIRIEANHKKQSWSGTLWKLQLVLNITKQKTTQTSALNLLIGTDATTPVIRALVREVAIEDNSPNREALREISRDRARRLLRDNQEAQDSYANRHRRPPREFDVDDLVFVIKTSQSTGKLDSGMRGPYKVIKKLPSGRYTLKLLAGGYGKTTQAAAQFMVPWKGEWCPETCAALFSDDNSDDPGDPNNPVAGPSAPGDSDNPVAGPSAPTPGASTGLSMPMLDSEPETAANPVEDDLPSGEAVLGINPVA